MTGKKNQTHPPQQKVHIRDEKLLTESDHEDELDRELQTNYTGSFKKNSKKNSINYKSAKRNPILKTNEEVDKTSLTHCSDLSPISGNANIKYNDRSMYEKSAKESFEISPHKYTDRSPNVSGTSGRPRNVQKHFAKNSNGQESPSTV